MMMMEHNNSNYMTTTPMMKRKGGGSEQDFSDFSLSSPARKIRRLDAELPPIIEEEEAEVHMGFEHQMPESSVSNGATVRPISLVDIEELPYVPENEEKAIVLYNPANNLLVYGNNSFSVDPSLISSFKNQAFLGAHLNTPIPNSEEDVTGNKDSGEGNTCRAVIPWAPSQPVELRPETVAPQIDTSDLMDADEMMTDVSTMDVEDGGALNFGQQTRNCLDSRISEGLQQQWQQQHCMIQQPPQNVTTPIVWYR